MFGNKIKRQKPHWDPPGALQAGAYQMNFNGFKLINLSMFKDLFWIQVLYKPLHGDYMA